MVRSQRSCKHAKKNFKGYRNRRIKKRRHRICPSNKSNLANPTQTYPCACNLHAIWLLTLVFSTDFLFRAFNLFLLFVPSDGGSCKTESINDDRAPMQIDSKASSSTMKPQDVRRVLQCPVPTLLPWHPSWISYQEITYILVSSSGYFIANICNWSISCQKNFFPLLDLIQLFFIPSLSLILSVNNTKTSPIDLVWLVRIHQIFIYENCEQLIV